MTLYYYMILLIILLSRARGRAGDVQRFIADTPTRGGATIGIELSRRCPGQTERQRVHAVHRANRERPQGTLSWERVVSRIVVVDSSLQRWKIFVYYYHYCSDDGRVRACSYIIKYIIKYYSPVAATAAAPALLLCFCSAVVVVRTWTEGERVRVRARACKEMRLNNYRAVFLSVPLATAAAVKLAARAPAK